MNGGPNNWTAALSRAVMTLLVAAVLVSVVEPIFMGVVPVLLVVFVLIGVYRLVLGRFGRDGW